MNDVFARLVEEFEAAPVLVDIGASGEPPAIWQEIASHSIYIGFDPDLRDIHQPQDSAFNKAIILNEAVVAEDDKDEALFYLTHSPHCSSTLPPDMASLQNFLFADLFVVEKETRVKATTLNSVLDRLDLSHIDWMKVDSQGTDLRLFQSLQDVVRNKVLALDIEPGLIDAYRGEDLLMEAHQSLTREGFWLSNLDVKGYTRMRPQTLATIAQTEKEFDRALIERAVRSTPIYGEARYLRTFDWLAAQEATLREYSLLWMFAMIDGQWGFALDVAIEVENRFGTEAKKFGLRETTINHIRQVGRLQRRKQVLKMPLHLVHRVAKRLRLV